MGLWSGCEYKTSRGFLRVLFIILILIDSFISFVLPICNLTRRIDVNPRINHRPINELLRGKNWDYGRGVNIKPHVFSHALYSSFGLIEKEIGMES